MRAAIHHHHHPKQHAHCHAPPSSPGPPPRSQDACLEEAVQQAANPPFLPSLVARLGARSICLSVPRKAAHVLSLGRRGMLAVPLEGLQSVVCTPSGAAEELRQRRLLALNFNEANLSEWTVLIAPGGLYLTRVAALGFLGGSYNDAIAEHLLPHEMERPGAAYHDARQRTNAVQMGQRKAAGGSRDGSSELRGGVAWNWWAGREWQPRPGRLPWQLPSARITRPPALAAPDCWHTSRPACLRLHPLELTAPFIPLPLSRFTLGAGKAVIAASLEPAVTLALQSPVKADLGSLPNTAEGLRSCYARIIALHAAQAELVRCTLAAAREKDATATLLPLLPGTGRGILVGGDRWRASLGGPVSARGREGRIPLPLAAPRTASGLARHADCAPLLMAQSVAPAPLLQALAVLEAAVEARGGTIDSIKAKALVQLGAHHLSLSPRRAGDIRSAYGIDPDKVWGGI